MPGETFRTFSQFAGKRVANDPELEQACDVIDNLPCTDLLSLLTVASHTRSAQVSPRELIDGNRFHRSSNVPQRDFHWLEGVIHDAIGEEIDFVELSPLQPFGINRQLADTNQKNIVSALRRSEANADATTALFRIALQRYASGIDGAEGLRIATNTRTVRAQSFGENTSFLPHFKVFGQVSVGSQSEDYGSKELEAIVDHMGSEIDIMDKLATSERSNIKNIDICVGNIALLGDLIDKGIVDAVEARQNTSNPDYSFIKQNNLDIPEYLSLSENDVIKNLKELGFQRGVKVTEKLKQNIETLRPDILPKVRLHLGRVAGIGYYRHICYKLTAENNDGVIPIADGGSTDWATKITGNKQLYTVTSGIGTELVCQYLLTK